MAPQQKDMRRPDLSTFVAKPGLPLALRPSQLQSANGWDRN
jgi:hypothetical protein